MHGDVWYVHAVDPNCLFAPPHQINFGQDPVMDAWWLKCILYTQFVRALVYTIDVDLHQNIQRTSDLISTINWNFLWQIMLAEDGKFRWRLWQILLNLLILLSENGRACVSYSPSLVYVSMESPMNLNYNKEMEEEADLLSVQAFLTTNCPVLPSHIGYLTCYGVDTWEPIHRR